MSFGNWMTSMTGEQSLWTVAADVATDSDFQMGMAIVIAVCFFYCLMMRMRCLLLMPIDVSKEIKDPNQIRGKKELLDSLLAISRSREVESIPPAVADNDVLVHVGDENETDLRNPLIPKRADEKLKKKCRKEADKPKTVTVTVQFSENLSEPDMERLVDELGKFLVAPAACEGEEGVGSLRWLLPARAVQGRVQLGESTLSQLENLHKIASGIGKGCAVQVESWGVLLEEGHWELNLLQETPLPVIIHSEYAAGILALCGKDLRGAKIYVTDGKHSIMFEDFEIQEDNFGKEKKRSCMSFKYNEIVAQNVEIPLRLSTNDLEKVIVYASKARKMAARSLVIHSTAVQIKDALWNTVFQRWIVGNLLLVFIIVQVTKRLHYVFTWAQEEFPLSSYFFAFYILMALPAVVPSRQLRRLCYEYVRIFRTVYLAVSDVKRKPHFSTLACSKQLSSDSEESSRSPPKPSSAVLSESSRSVKSFVSSILKKEKSNNTSISKEWEPCIVENVVHMGLSTMRKMEKHEDDIDPDNNPFVIIYKRDDEKHAQLPWPEELRFEVASQHLVKILKKHLTFQGNVFCTERPEVPGRDLFVHMDSLSIEDAGIKEEHLSKAQLHLDLLVKHVKKEYKDVSPRLKRMKEEKLVSFDMLWAFLYRGQKVVYKCEYTNASLCAKVAEKVQYKREGKRCVALVLLKVYYYNGQKYIRFNIVREIVEFGGERVFEALPVCPIGLMSKPEEVMEAEFMKHGRKYYELVIQQNYRYMNYQGAMHCVKSKPRSGTYSSGQVNGDGRVMIATLSFFSTNPGFKMFQEDSRTRKCGGGHNDQSQDYDSSVAPKELSDKKLMFAPGVAVGFSFALRQWGVFSVGGFSDVEYDATAFNELVMDQDDKSLLRSLVSQYVADPHQKMVAIDPISKKGEGCVILCYGPPGTGKTLTAESLAENLGRPLWALSLSQFGTDPEKLESSLSTVLNTASLWQAILLLDEADIFLEKRTNNMDLARNAMIGVFLRQLEYYRGIMFLTTNRVSAFDDAVRSRVSMLVCYRQFTVAERAQIWKTLLSRAGMHDVAELDELSSLDLNGREIRNVVHAAQVWAKSNSSALEMEHVKYVVEVFTRSVGTLQQVVRESLGA